MFDKTKKGINNLKDSSQKKLLIKKQKKLEKDSAKMIKQKETLKIELDDIQLQKDKLEEEKERLKLLDDKELMIELIFAVRDFYSRYSELEDNYKNISDRIYEQDRTIEDIKDQISNLQYKIAEIEQDSSMNNY